MKIKFSVSDLTQDDLTNIIETAIYDSDWLSIHVSEESRPLYEASDFECHSEALADVLLKGGTIRVVDHEEDDEDDEEENLGMLVDLKTLIRKLNMYLKKYPKYVSEVLPDGDCDYYTWNNFFQVVLYNEIVYG